MCVRNQSRYFSRAGRDGVAGCVCCRKLANICAVRVDGFAVNVSSVSEYMYVCPVRLYLTNYGPSCPEEPIIVRDGETRAADGGKVHNRRRSGAHYVRLISFRTERHFGVCVCVSAGAHNFIRHIQRFDCRMAIDERECVPWN